MRLPIRQVPVRRLASAAARWILLVDGRLASPDEIDDPTAALRSDRPPNGGMCRKFDEVHYQQITCFVTTARESGFSPHEYVAERLGPASVPDVDRWIVEPKRRGYLRRNWSATTEETGR
jgi:hypothetical protein